MNDNMQGGNLQSTGRYLQDVIKCLPPKRPLRCLDLGSGVRFTFEKMLFQSKGGESIFVDCVDRHAPDQVGRVPERINYIQGSIEDKLTFETKYDCIFCFEVIEHIDCTDVLIQSCYNNLKKDGLFFIAWPNLTSLYSRIELLLGYQPHLLEVSNERANYGMGMFGKMNNPSDSVLHHIRGISYRAMSDMLAANGFKVEKAVGNDRTSLLRKFPRIASTVMLICSKGDQL